MDGFGQIAVSVRESDLHIAFTIRDNGPGMAAGALKQIAAAEEGHFGIKSIQKRILMHYGDDYGITMQNIQSGGLETTILIPKQKRSSTDGSDEI